MKSRDLAELALDIQALAPDIATGASAAARWMTQPAIARRVAMAMAERVPSGTDRLVSSGEAAELLGTAVSLTTGLPVLIVTDHDELGDQHPGEAVFSIALTEPGGESGPAGRAIDLVLIGTSGLPRCILRSVRDQLIPVGPDGALDLKEDHD